MQREKWGGYEVGDGVVVLQLNDVRFIGIIVYIYDSIIYKTCKRCIKDMKKVYNFSLTNKRLV